MSRIAGIISSHNEPNRLANRLTNEQAHECPPLDLAAA